VALVIQRQNSHDERYEQQQRVPPVLPKHSGLVCCFSRYLTTCDAAAREADRIDQERNVINSNADEITPIDSLLRTFTVKEEKRAPWNIPVAIICRSYQLQIDSQLSVCTAITLNVP
jgi:hypothetical protein